MQAVQKANKTATSPMLKYKYVAHAELVADLRTALMDAGLVMVPVEGTFDLGVQHFKNSDGWHAITGYSFDIIHAESGDTLRIGPVFGEGFDSGDKAVPKANTNAHKYAMLLTFMLPSDDDPEGDGETDVPREQSNQSTGGQSGSTGRSRSSGVTLDSECPFKKFKGQKWSAVFSDKDGPSYVDWLLTNIDDMDAGMRAFLEAEKERRAGGGSSDAMGDAKAEVWRRFKAACAKHDVAEGARSELLGQFMSTYSIDDASAATLEDLNRVLAGMQDKSPKPEFEDFVDYWVSENGLPF